MDVARPVDRLPNDFIRDAFGRSVKCGLVHSDLCAKNVMRRGHRLGYIDLDTVFVDLRRFDVEFERAHGALRPHVHPLYRSLVEGFLRCWKPIT